MRSKSRGRASRGFTLAELLVVLAIIALLIALLTPVVIGARRQARDVVCMSNLHTLGVGMIAYATEFNGVLPWDGYAEGDREIGRHLGRWHEPSVWFNSMPKYAGMQPYYELQDEAAAGGRPLSGAGGKTLFTCPSAGPAMPGNDEDQGNIRDGFIHFWGLNEAGVSVQRPTFWCYGFNTQLDQGREDRDTNGVVRISMPLSKIRNTAITAVLVEKVMRPTEYNPPGASVGQQQVSYNEFTTRHRGGGFILMADAHVAFFTRNEVMFPPTAPGSYALPGRLVWNPPKK